MNPTLLKIGRFLLAIILGYAAMILGLVLVQDLTLGRPVLGETPLWNIGLVGVGSFLAAGLGGFMAAKISKAFLPAIFMCVATVLETINLTLSGKFDNPMWFEIVAELTLILGIIWGARLVLKK